MLYCFRERELLLNINEMIAGFRMFPSYMRIGGLREDLPRGFHDAVRAFLRSPAGEARRVRGSPLEERDLLEARTKASASFRKTMRSRTAWSGRLPARRAWTTTCASISRISATTRYEFTVPVQTRGDVYSRYQVRIAEMRESLKICRQALERITPTGPFAIDDPRITPPPKDRVYTEMEALIQHFLIYSQGFTVPAGEAYVPVEGPRGEHGFSVVSDGTNRPWRIKSRAPVAAGLSGARTHDRRRTDRRRHRGDWID